VFGGSTAPLSPICKREVVNCQLESLYGHKGYLRSEEVVDLVGVRGHEDLDLKALRHVKHQVDEALLELIAEQRFWLYSQRIVILPRAAN
jgi:hypothetical protein